MKDKLHKPVQPDRAIYLIIKNRIHFYGLSLNSNTAVSISTLLNLHGNEMYSYYGFVFVINLVDEASKKV